MSNWFKECAKSIKRGGKILLKLNQLLICNFYPLIVFIFQVLAMSDKMFKDKKDLEREQTNQFFPESVSGL